MIRITKIDDAEYITSIILSCNTEFIEPITKKPTFDDSLKKIVNYSNFIVAIKDDVPIGYIAFYSNDDIAYTAYVSLLAVNSKYHNQGIGHMLMQECEKIARTNGMKKIKLAVLKDNENAIRFYQKHGFTYLCERDETRFYMIKTVS